MRIFLITWNQHFACPVGLASLARACLPLTVEHSMPDGGQLSLTWKPKFSRACAHVTGLNTGLVRINKSCLQEECYAHEPTCLEDNGT